MQFQTSITKGKAVITPDGLRCRAAHPTDATRTCNKLIVKKNASGQIAGNFQCERCQQQIEVVVSQS